MQRVSFLRRLSGSRLCLCGVSFWLTSCSNHLADSQTALQGYTQELRRMQRDMEWMQEQVLSHQHYLEALQQSPANTASHWQSGLEHRLSAAEQILDVLGKDIALLQGEQQQWGRRLDDLQKTRLAQLEKRLAEVSRVRTDVQELVAAFEKESPGEEATRIVVRAGDTLEKIARRHHTTVEVLRRLNQVRGDLIQVGQSLAIPKQP